MDNNSLTFVSIGGVGDVTKNMSAYIFGDEVLLVDCGMGFVDESMPGVDLVIPNISYLKSLNKKIVGMVLTHGHEDHIGALPFVLPQLPQFPIYGTRLTAELANEKLGEFGEKNRVTAVKFDDNIKIGSFSASFARVTHSILDTAHILIRTPIGNFYHGSDFKFDLTPVDGQVSEIRKIAKWGEEGILCTMSDCLGAEKPGHSETEIDIINRFDEEVKKTKGKVFISTYSSNISRMNQAIDIAKKYNRKVCFIGRSFLKVRDIARKLKYMNLSEKLEVKPQDIKKLQPSNVLILVAGSQAQLESGLVRIAEDRDRDLRINRGDTVILSSDPIPGNEVNINSLIDTLSRRGAHVVHTDTDDRFHVSGHGFQNDLKLLLSLTSPKFVLPIGGQYRHMAAYRDIATTMGYHENDVIFADNAREVIFTHNGFRYGRENKLANVYVDQVSGESVEKYIVLDRQKIAEEGVAIIVTEIETATGQLHSPPDVIAKGATFADKEKFVKLLSDGLSKEFSQRQERVTNWNYYRRHIQQKAEELLYREKREPLVVPVILEV